MRNVIMCSALLGGVFLAAPPVTVVENADKPVEQKVAETPTLTKQLTLREEQGGIGGTSVKTWTITPDGKWSIERWSLDTAGKEAPKTRRNQGRGSLSTERLATVAGVVLSQELVELPDEMGTKPKVNPHVYILRYGPKTSSLYGVPTQRSNPLKDHLIAWGPRDQSSAVNRFATVAQAIIDACQAVPTASKKD
jgi:hypothetical protein